VNGAFRRRPDVLWRRSLDAVMVLAPGADDVSTFAGTGVAVWELLDTWRSIDALTEILSAEYGADPAVVRADVAELIGRLEGLGALEMAADSGGPETG
jgi:hypothetical protein